MPRRSIETTNIKERREIIWVIPTGSSESILHSKVFYHNFNDVKSRVPKLSLPSWEVNQQIDKIVFKRFTKPL